MDLHKIDSDFYEKEIKAEPRGYKLFSCSTQLSEHEILNAHKYKNIRN